MKLSEIKESIINACRAPHGARGLKPVVGADYLRMLTSRPARGAWIETPYSLHRG